MAALLAAEVYASAYADGIVMEPVLTVSQWADRFRILDTKTSAQPGPWDTARTPYLREIQDELSPQSGTWRLAFQKGSQIGGTEAANNFLGFIITCAPAPVLMVLPTVEIAARVSKQRIAPMIALVPELREKVKSSRSRDAGNTTHVKEFEGGLVMLAGANSGAGLRSMPIRFLICDEIDDYPGDVDNQGDPLSLAEKRTSTFAQKKIYVVSTPTVKGVSRIEKEFLAGDQRRYFIPCPHCGHMDFIQWRIGGWDGHQGRHHHIQFEEHKPETARLCCAQCDKLIEEHEKTRMLELGEWRPTATCEPGRRSYHLSSLYSPVGWRSWPNCVAEFLEVKHDPFRLKQWVNTVLGETWEEPGQSVQAGSLLARAERYAAEVPTGVGALVASVDVQGDRLEAKVLGFGAGEESWLIAFSQFHGDPAQAKVWAALDEFLKQTFEHESGRRFKIDIVVVDAKFQSEAVYKFCAAREYRNIYAVTGGTEKSKPVVGRPTRNNVYRAKHFSLCVDTAKDLIYSRMTIANPGAGFMHFPEWTDQDYVDQLTAERAIRRYVKGKGSVREWHKVGRRNEALDLEVYCLAALYILGPTFVRGLEKRAEKWAIPAEDRQPGGSEPPPSSEPAQKPRRPRRRSWVKDW